MPVQPVCSAAPTTRSTPSNVRRRRGSGPRRRSSFPSGYQANVGLLAALAGPRDALVLDERIHASLVDGARLSRARRLIHRHLDLDDLERKLRQAKTARRRFIVTESVFSMDGLGPDREAMIRLARECDAWLIVDEAHAVGVLGQEGRGVFAPADGTGDDAEGNDAANRIATRLVTGGKALGAAGAVIVGSRAVIDTVVNRSRSFVFTTGVSPASAATMRARIKQVRSADERRDRVRALTRRLAEKLDVPVPRGAVVPFVVGDEVAALDVAESLRNRGFRVRAVRPPTVPPGEAGLRLVCHATNDEAAVEELAAALVAWREKTSVSGASSDEDHRRPDARGREASTTATHAKRSTPVFIVGTDTDVGKTVASALIVHALRRRGSVRYWKPVQTGVETGGDGDTETVQQLTSNDIDHDHRHDSDSLHFATPRYVYPLPASPHEAAAAAGETIDVDEIHHTFETVLTSPRPSSEMPTRSTATSTLTPSSTSPPDFLVTEFAGGLLVPLTDDVTQADWLVRHRGDIVLVARSGLGTLNHTLLTAEALVARGRRARTLILVGPRHDSNRETLRRSGLFDDVFELELLDRLDATALAAWPDLDRLGEALS